VSTNQPEKVAALQAGKMPIYEPGLEEMVGRNVADARLAFTTDLAAGRPTRADHLHHGRYTSQGPTGETDLGAVEQVAAAIGRAMEKYTVIVKQIDGPGGNGRFRPATSSRATSARRVPFDVVSNPEFLREGSAIEDTLRPDRIVIGAPNQQVAMTLLELYAPLERPMIINRRCPRPR